MSIEIKTASMQPIRNTYSHINRRFGDKPATRYQEATYDAQATDNFHYQPLWTDKTLNDKNHTALKMEDWYAFRDPRQFYYGAYVQKRARMQENAENNYAFFEKRNMVNYLPEATKQALINGLLPLRHVEQTANLNYLSGSAYGYGTTITQACLYAGMDRMGIAQYLSRIGLLFDGNSAESLEQAKAQWMEDSTWQGVRALCEEMLVQQDWFELFIAQGLLIDTVLQVAFYQQIEDWLVKHDGRDVAMLTEFMQECLKEQANWSDSVYKVAAAESEDNKKLLNQWVEKWLPKVKKAYEPVINTLYADDAAAVHQQITTDLNKRLKKVGLSEQE